MKALLKIFIPMCVVSFIAFGISVAVFGTNDSSLSSDMVTELTEDYDSIEIDVGVYDCDLRPGSGDITKVSVSGDNVDGIKANVSNGRLKVYTQKKWFNFNFLFWRSNTRVTVEVPEKIYNELQVGNTSGDTTVAGVSAKTVSLKSTSGSIKYDQPQGFTTEDFFINITSGEVVATNASTKNYKIRETSGSIDVSGLTGTGMIKLTSGDMNIAFLSLDGNCDFNMTSGNATLTIPDDASADIVCKKTSGTINVVTDNLIKNVSDNSTVRLGEGGITINAKLTSGDLVIKDTKTTAGGDVNIAQTIVQDGFDVITEVVESNVDTAFSIADSAISDALEW